MRVPSTARRVILLILVLVVFVAPFSPVPGFLSFVISPIERPLLLFGKALLSGFSRPLTVFRSKSALEKENHELNTKVSNISSASLENSILRTENDRLRAVLGRDEERSSLTLATVLAGESRSFYGSVIIDLGTKNGVSVGDVVLANQHLAIGMVQEAGTSISKVRLFSGSGEKTEAFIGESKLELLGDGGGVYHIELPHDFPAKVGDVARLAPNLGTTDARPTILGSVEMIENKGDSVFVYVNSNVNMRSLEYVFVRKP